MPPIIFITIGTFRTIVTVQGRSVLAFFLAILEFLIWITVVSAVIQKIKKDQTILALFYAFGFATGNVMGFIAFLGFAVLLQKHLV